MEIGSVIKLNCKREEGDVPSYLSVITERQYNVLFDALSTVLKNDEANIYRQFKIEKKKKDYLLAVFAAKTAASEYLGEKDLTKINMATGTFNQPFIRHLSEDIPDITITHSNSIALAIACKPGHPMGIDIEKLAPTKIDVFKTQLTDNEINIVKNSGLDEAIIFNQIWTIKEALSKALKCGLTTPFKILEIDKPEFIDDGMMICYFKNFGQYKCYSFIINGYALSIVLPKKTDLKIDPNELSGLLKV